MANGGARYKWISNINNKSIVDELRFGLAERPGLYFDYDGDARKGIQAVGTDHKFTTTLHGQGTELLLDNQGNPIVTVTVNGAAGYDDWIKGRERWADDAKLGIWILSIPAHDVLIGRKATIRIGYKTVEFGREFT